MHDFYVGPIQGFLMSRNHRDTYKQHKSFISHFEKFENVDFRRLDGNKNCLQTTSHSLALYIIITGDATFSHNWVFGKGPQTMTPGISGNV
jgi:hypothetical protein